MKKLICLVLAVMLALSFLNCIAIAEDYSFDVYEEFSTYYFGVFHYEMKNYNTEQIYSTGYNRAVFAFELLTALSFDTGMSTGESDYVIQWRGDMIVGKSKQYESEMMLAALVYNRSQKQPVIVFCRYNPTTKQAYYALKEYDSSLIQYYMVYDMGNSCGDDNYERIEIEDMNQVISEVEEQIGMPLFG